MTSKREFPQYSLIAIIACLTLIGSTSANQNPENYSSYHPESKILTIPVVKVGRDYLSAELKDQGDYHFKLISYTIYAGVVPESYPKFDTVRGMLSIPYLIAFDKIWSITLTFDDKSLLIIDKVQEVDLTAKPDPLETKTPRDRFSINDDGTVTDNETGLQWMRCSLGQTWDNNNCSGYPTTVAMEDATYSADRLAFAGKNDWRLPSIHELKSLIYCSSGKPKYWNNSGSACTGDYHHPTLYQDAFPYNASGVYWTSTNLQSDPGYDYNLTVSFNYGHVFYSYFKDAYEHARFVRGTSNITPNAESIGGFKE